VALHKAMCLHEREVMAMSRTAATVTYLTETRREQECSQPGLPLVITMMQ